MHIVDLIRKAMAAFWAYLKKDRNITVNWKPTIYVVLHQRSKDSD